MTAAVHEGDWLATREAHGVWGGTSEEERRRLR